MDKNETIAAINAFEALYDMVRVGASSEFMELFDFMKTRVPPEYIEARMCYGIPAAEALTAVLESYERRQFLAFPSMWNPMRRPAPPR